MATSASYGSLNKKGTILLILRMFIVSFSVWNFQKRLQFCQTIKVFGYKNWPAVITDATCDVTL